MVFRSLLDHPRVDEVCTLRSTFGLMAFHGGNLERSTDVIAREVAERTDSSLYAVIQHPPMRQHVPSTQIDPADSPMLQGFIDHVDTVIAVHGYGRDTQFWDILLGGQNRDLARHLAGFIRPALPDQFGVIAELDDMPRGLRGQHRANPVNLPRHSGVQLELPPPARWNEDEKNWSDHDGTGRAPQVSALIEALIEAVDAWSDA